MIRTIAPAARLWLNRFAAPGSSARAPRAVITIQPATADDIPTLRALARRIWDEYYPGIISREQIDYMLARMYDATTLRREMAEGVAWDLVRRGTEQAAMQSGGHTAPHSDAARAQGAEARAGSESGAPVPRPSAHQSGSHPTEPVGFMSYSVDAASRRAKLSKLYLLPALHGHGIGRQMVQHVRARSVELGALEIWLQVNKQNIRAIRAYERAGFGIREAVVNDIGGGFVMDDFIMVLRLRELKE
jgi:ribosomal protein S18 acetylase RimI-like enzyme